MKRSILLVAILVSIPLVFVLNLALGSVSIPLDAVVDILFGRGEAGSVWEAIVMKTRLPQALTALMAGAGLAVSGLEMQTVFHNPLAGPSVLGVSSSASLGVALVVMLSGAFGGSFISEFGWLGNSAITLAAALGAGASMAVIMFLSTRVHGKSTLLIVGVMIGYIASAIVGVLKYFSAEEDVHAFVIWGLGSFSRVTGGQIDVFVATMCVVLPLSMLLIKPLNQLLLGEQYAQNLGLNLRRAQLLIICSAGLLVAIVTAYCGPVMFLGLAAPHIARGVFNTADHRIQMPATLFTGASLALVCNLIARLPGMEGALPINSVTSLIGAPVALWVLLNKKK